MLRASLAVQKQARQGYADDHQLRLAVQSILAQEAPDSIAALAGLDGLRPGLELLCPFLYRGPAEPQEAEILRYTLSLAKLGRRLLRHPQAFARVEQGIRQARRQLDHFNDLLHPSVLAGLAETYAEGIGSLRPRIIVTGESRFLSREEDATRIRTFLLAGVRATVLWHQSGGRIWNTLLERESLCGRSRYFLSQLSPSPGH
ncbi:MAG: DUF489 family protein [Acidithiobacillus sp.]|nr:DUF489 family protein [Acidithiobacillus sp.]